MADLPQASTDSRNATIEGVRALRAISAALANIIPSFGTTSTTATAGAETLPSNPAGFVNVVINGVSVKIAYYNP